MLSWTVMMNQGTAHPRMMIVPLGTLSYSGGVGVLAEVSSCISLEPGSPLDLAREKLFPRVRRERAWKILITCWTWLDVVTN